ncbi:FecR domain-containing protein [Sphingobium sp. BYY-5]|uniref:FecR family protein n=1 Tax=Sphingobium sp. BYY-5 TaxID=2926400 RepID=UPI001FA6EA18|nr:FecR domain-containing protein [Sphingobium sp. BYY-5]MCI4588852.1 FecR domain-containing protein [Sphingobium sp. BYY-5]
MTARPAMNEQVLDQAIAWQAALEQDDADWDGYLAWLETDPRHRDAYDSIALLDAAILDNRDRIKLLLAPAPVVETTADPISRRWRPRMFWTGAIAASLAMLVAAPVLRSGFGPDSTTYDNDGTTTRNLALANGTNVILAPASRIIVTGKDATAIELARGEAYFDVRHDPGRTLTVSAGNYRISDIGTQFSVNLAGGNFRVGVAEGTVSVKAPNRDEPVRLDSGHQLVGSDRGFTLGPVETTQVGSWRSGRLSYTDAPLTLVAADITRYSGKAIVVDPSVEKKHFSGSLVIGDGSRLVGDLVGVMGVDAQPAGETVRISAAR